MANLRLRGEYLKGRAMTTTPLTIYAIYGTHNSAESAADALMKEGAPSGSISVLLPENVPNANVDTKIQPGLHSKPVVGATPRGALSGALGVLAGLGMLAVPGLGPLVGEGTLKAGLAGLGLENTVGNFAKYLINLGVPELEAKRYEDRLNQQAILLTVRCDSPYEAIRLTQVVKRTGGEDVCTAAEPSVAQNPQVASEDTSGTSARGER